MDSSASESEDILQSVLPLDRVSPSRLKPDSLVQGEITNCTSYKDGVASITLKDSSGILSVQFKGEWAEEAIKKFNKIGKWINFEGKGGTAEAIRDKRGELVLRDNKYKTYRLVYSNGVEGVWNQNAKGPSFFFKSQSISTGTRYSSASTNPHARPSSTSSSKHQRALANLNQNEPTLAAALDEEILSAPSSNRSNPYQRQPKMHLKVHVELSSDQFSQSDEQSEQGVPFGESNDDDEEEARIEEQKRKKQKRIRKESRREWGMKSTISKLEYSPLNVIENLGNKPKLNFIAIALQKREIYKTKNDWATELWLYDPTHTKTPARLVFFDSKGQLVPSVKNGDILIVQDINWQKDRNQLTAFGGRSKGQYLVIPAKLAEDYQGGQPSTLLSQLEKPLGRLAKVGEEELLYARDVARWSKKFDVVGNHEEPARQDTVPRTAAEISAQLSKGGGNQRPFVSISEIEPNVFYDIQGEIIKMYNDSGQKIFEDDNDHLQLFITDYTRNESLIKYEDLSNVRLPGQFALQITVYGHQAKPLLKFGENDLIGKMVYCRNVRGKLNTNGLLEATMYVDEKRRDKSDVSFRTESQLSRESWLKNFNRRRDLYCEASLERKLNDPLLTLDEKGRIEATTYADPFASIFNTLGLEKQSMSVALQHGMSGSYLFNARVIDYKPDKLEDFVVAYCTECRAPLAKGLRQCMDHDQVSHMWQFAVILEGESTTSPAPRILVEVSGRQAEALFPGLSPAQMFEDSPTHLPKLKSRLSPLLGNLPQLKSTLSRGAIEQSINPRESDLGQWMDFVVKGSKVGNGQFKWKFDDNRTTFIDL